MSLVHLTCRRVAQGLALALALLFAAPSIAASWKAIDFSPEDGATVDRPVRSLRVWFDQSPDVEQSTLRLEGPQGELEVTGLHTMGEDDLMARVVGRMPDGRYTATWTIGAGDDAASGTWSFEVQRAAGEAAASDAIRDARQIELDPRR